MRYGRLTFDLSGLPKAGPLEGRVRRQREHVRLTLEGDLMLHFEL